MRNWTGDWNFASINLSLISDTIINFSGLLKHGVSTSLDLSLPFEFTVTANTHARKIIAIGFLTAS